MNMVFVKGNKIGLLAKLTRCKKCGRIIGRKEHICVPRTWIEKECLYCSKPFSTIPADIKRGHGKFCSVKCRQLNLKGKSIFINGKAEKNSNWKDDKVSYKGLHKWIGEQLGKPTVCEICRKTGLTGRWIHWANISGLYLRNPTDWIRLCAKCHKKFDKKDVKDKRKANYLAEGIA